MNSTNTPHPEQSDLPEDESRMLPKLEDLAALTGLFNPALIIDEMLELDRLDDIEQAEVPQLLEDDKAEEAKKPDSV